MLLFLFLFGLALGAVAPSCYDEEEYVASSGDNEELYAKPLLKANCPNLWISFNSRCFKYVSNKMSWVDAELYCVSEGANLASIHSLEEHNFVKALIKNSDVTQYHTWIGLNDIYKEGKWLWSDGSAAKFVNWNKGEPNNYGGNENCVMTNYDVGKKWNDSPCSGTYAFVCESRTIWSP